MKHLHRAFLVTTVVFVMLLGLVVFGGVRLPAPRLCAELDDACPLAKTMTSLDTLLVAALGITTLVIILGGLGVGSVKLARWARRTGRRPWL